MRKSRCGRSISRDGFIFSLLILVCRFQLVREARDWQGKHEKLSEEIKAYHLTQTELENALVHKENEIDVRRNVSLQRPGACLIATTEHFMLSPLL